ncbi:MAG TPA: alpha-L-fucosidase, partial [Isosphaeraceae bacterium]
ALVAGSALRAGPPDPPRDDPGRAPAGQPLLEFHFLADQKHDGAAVEQARTAGDGADAPAGYRWVRLDDRARLQPGENVIVRQEAAADGSSRKFVLVQLDPQGVTEKDLARVEPARDSIQRLALKLAFTPRGADRFGALTRTRLPEDGGDSRFHLAVIVDGVVRSAPVVMTEIRDVALIEGIAPEEVDPLIARLSRAAAAGGNTANAAARRQFEDARFGLFVHWGVYSLLGKGEWVMEHDKIPIAEYRNLPPRFNPARFDAEQWVATAKAAGMKYITITSKHHDGFCMFDSKLTEYDIVDTTPYGTDPLKALADACHEQGLKLFFYYSLLDWHHPDYFPRGRTGKTAGREETGDWARYVAYYQGQVRELCTNYGEIGGIWFDGWWDRPDASWDLAGTYKLIHELQPGALVGNNHHVAPFEGEDFQMFEQDLPGENTAGFNKAETTGRLPLETCLTLNKSWGYNAGDQDFKSPEQVIHYLLGAVGRGANLLLNVGPGPDGTIGPEFTERLREVGRWLERNGEAVYGTRRGPIAPQPWGVSVQKGPAIYLHVLEPADRIVLPKEVAAFDAWVFGGQARLPLKPAADGVALELPEDARTPIDTIAVLRPKFFDPPPMRAGAPRR